MKEKVRLAKVVCDFCLEQKKGFVISFSEKGLEFGHFCSRICIDCLINKPYNRIKVERELNSKNKEIRKLKSRLCRFEKPTQLGRSV